MSNLLKRYLGGEHETVWRELGTGQLAARLVADVDAVARETMRRVKDNLDLLVARLKAEGFQFKNPMAPKGDDANARYFAVRAQPTTQTSTLLPRTEDLVGSLPRSVRAFYELVGAVNLDGHLGDALTTAEDPLMVSPLEYVETTWKDWNDGHHEEDGPFAWEFAPDVLHKDDTSGGPPFRIELPSPGADGIVLEDSWGRVPFVAYLRTTLQWAGFPGLRHRKGAARHESLVAKLTDGLEPF